MNCANFLKIILKFCFYRFCFTFAKTTTIMKIVRENDNRTYQIKATKKVDKLGVGLGIGCMVFGFLFTSSITYYFGVHFLPSCRFELLCDLASALLLLAGVSKILDAATNVIYEVTPIEEGQFSTN